MRTPSRVLLTTVLLLTAAGTALAQSSDFYGPQTIDATNRGGAWYNPAQQGLSYRHDLSNGAISLRLEPWGIIKSARGPAIPFALVYFYGQGVSMYGPYPPNGQWDANGPPATNVNPDGSLWTEGTPTLLRSGQDFVDVYGEECSYAGPYIYTDFAGLGHDLGLGTILYTDPGGLCYGSGLTASQALDQPSLYSAFAPGTETPPYVTDGSGTRFYFDWSSGSGVLTKIEDANGNYVTVTGATGAGPEFWTDAAGKTVLEVIRSQYGGSVYLPTEIFVNGTAGWTTQEYIATWTQTSSTGMPMAYPNNATCYCSMNTTIGVGGYELTGLQLPDGSHYTISYDATTGAVSQINYPAGGWIRFGYSDAQQIATCTFGNPEGPGFQYLPCDQIAATDEWRNDGTTTTHWTYSYTGSVSNGIVQSVTTVVTDPLGQKTTYSYGGMNLGSSSGSASFAMFETQRTVATAAGAALRTTTSRYQSGWPNLLAGVQTVFSDAPSAESTETDYGYDSYGNRTSQNDYGFAACSAPAPPTYPPASFGCGPGSLLRQTTWTYLADTTPWIVDKPLTETIADPSGNPQSETQWEYDVYSGANHAALAASGAVEHDSAYNAGGGITQRGNNTAISRCKTFSGASCTVWLTAYAQYDDTGNRILDIDPAGNHTSYSFADAWADSLCTPAGQSASFLTQVTDALGHATRATYYSCTGELATRTGPNGNTTSLQYSDPFNRPTQINFPDGGETAYSYTASTRETKRLQDTSGDWMDTLETADGLGRPTVTAVKTAANQWSRADTCYNSIGEAGFTSYPYYSSAGGGAPNCAASGDSFAFDALGRQTQNTHSDSSTFLTSYAGAAAETEDEGNGTTRVTHILQNNALGQLTSVCEVTSASDAAGNAPANCGLDLAGTGFLTSYTHDLLGNLTYVAQGAESRSFVYDPLSRLISATNPETGTVNYTYDAAACSAPADAGALTCRTDARGVTTGYSYDAENRLTQKIYSDGTPTATYVYSQATVDGFSPANSVDRLSSEGSGATAAVLSYDQMGRTTADYQCFSANCSTSAYLLSYGYDRAGDATSASNGEGWTFTRSFDLAGRLTGLASNNFDANHPATLASAISRNARGEITAVLLGNGVTETRAYDSNGRGLLLPIADGSQYSATMAYAPDGAVTSGNDSVNGNWTYSYDPLQRLATSACAPNASSNCPDGSGAESFAYSYDRYGNRWRQTVTSGSGPQPAFSFTGGNNRPDGYSFDASGDLLNDGVHNYAYDAEHRLISLDSGATAAYTYNADGRRVGKLAGSNISQYLLARSGEVVTAVYNGGWNRGEVYAAGRRWATYANATTYFPYTDQLGTVRANGDLGARVVTTCTGLPFGDGTACGVGVSPNYFTGKPRDSEGGGTSDLDYFGARYNSSMLGRFTTPDPLGGHPQNPQTLNKYAYAANNPVTLTDPSGLDFNLTCSPSSTNQTTCHGGVQGTTTEGQFTATLISGNANTGYHDQYGNAYSGSFSQLGIFFTESGGATSGARFVNTTGSDKNTLYGSGIFAGLTATFNDTCGASCVASGSVFASPMSLTSFENSGEMLKNPGLDDFDFFHGTFLGLGPQNFRYANPTGPSPHIVEQAKTQAAGYDEFHYDGSYPYASVPGFFDHVGSVFKSIIHLFTGPHPLPAPTTPYF